MRTTMMLAAAFAVFMAGWAVAADSAGESNWEKFKEGAKQAGSAAWAGTKNVAKKTGDFVGEKYDESKAYVDEKVSEYRAKEAATLPEPVPVEPSPANP
jgi:hypothetical protein